MKRHSSMNLEELIPYYPDIDADMFSEEIARKYEFLSTDDDDEAFFVYQRNVARFLSPHTVYDSLLLFHAMGTGKSSSALATVYACKNEDVGVKRVIVLANGKVQLSNFKNEIMSRLPFLTEKYPRVDPNTIFRKEGFVFDTYRMFAKKLDGKSTDVLRDVYDDSIFVCDEVHNLTTSSKAYSTAPNVMTNTKAYQLIHNLFHLLRRRKVLCLTGTPIRDQPQEIARALNLALPLSQQLPLDDAFLTMYMDVVHTVSVMGDVELTEYTMKPSMIDDFQRKVKGYVSYLKQSIPDNITVSYVTNVNVTVPLLDHFRVFALPMQEPQNTSYLEQFMRDLASHGGDDDDGEENEAGEEGGNDDDEEDEGGHVHTPSLAYTHARQAALMVFPQGDDSSEYVRAVYETSTKDVTKTTTMIRSFAWTPAMRRLFPSKVSFDEKIRVVGMYSCIYANIIREIVMNPTHLVYIYAFLKARSGVYILVSLLTQYFDFDIVRTLDDLEKPATHRRRVLILNHDFLSEQHLRRAIDAFNRDENAMAASIQVVIGTKQTKEGITLKNIQQIHILQPEWNYADISQAIGRGVRVNSHTALLRRGQTVQVRIFQYVTLPTLDGEIDTSLSIDLEQYRRSEIKDKNIKVIERQLMIASWDCTFNKAQNTGVVDGSRECEYMECQYTCRGERPSSSARDYSTYRMYFAKGATRRIQKHLQELFSRQNVYSRRDIHEVMAGVERGVIDDVIDDAQGTPNMMTNPISSPCTLRHDGDMVWTVTDVNQRGPLDMTYSLKPVYDMSTPSTYFARACMALYGRHLPNIITRAMTMFYADQQEHAMTIITRAPLPLQETILETIILDHVQRPATRPFYDAIMTHYTAQDRLRYTPPVYTSTILDVPRRLDTSRDDMAWTTVATPILTDTATLDEDSDAFREKYITGNEYKYYGILEVGATQTVFKIRDVHDVETILGTNKSKKNRGEVCGHTFSKKKNGLIGIIWALGWRTTHDDDEDLDEMDVMRTYVGGQPSLLSFLGVDVSSMSGGEVATLYVLLHKKIPELCGVARSRLEELDLVHVKRVS